MSTNRILPYILGGGTPLTHLKLNRNDANDYLPPSAIMLMNASWRLDVNTRLSAAELLEMWNATGASGENHSESLICIG